MRDDADRRRRFLVRAGWLILALVAAVAAAFAALAPDRAPRHFGYAIAVGLGCWLVNLGWVQAWYVLARRVVLRRERAAGGQAGQ